MSLELLTCEDFAPHVGTDFTLPGGEDSPAIVFTLTEAKPLTIRQNAAQQRMPFQLLFQMASPQVYPQGLYRLTHPAMGERDIFLVPAAQNDAGVEYCATFN